ncbi:hypothetical protein CDL15_Pgr022404 [Punica granatum]|uniref:Uncharacterized protein n=1 Tax=Punica granatum TaxID=22663 RepID=A0A218XQP5_PUNGR|nr:hypothetical protein CDL15_Pgr022404 [Punica granatum]
MYMWQACDFEPELAVQELVDASLVRLTDENRFWMHDQLRDLGRKLVRDERHHGKPCSRIWLHEDALKVLRDEEMCNELKILDLQRCDHLTKTPDLSMCTKLERLILKDCINLIKIDRSVGKLKCLKYLNASGCRYLREIPREVCCLDGLVDIVMIMEGGFKDSHKLPDSIGRLSRLQCLCVSLRSSFKDGQKLPDSIGRLERLQSLRVSLGRSTPPSSLGDLKSLTMLVLSWSKIAEIPESIGGLVKLELLSLFYCREVKKLPASIGNLNSLVELNISMSGITQLPDAAVNLQKLRVIDMRGCSIRRWPGFLGNLKKLERLDIYDCKYLRVIPSAIRRITSSLKVSLSAWDKSCDRYWKQLEVEVEEEEEGGNPFAISRNAPVDRLRRWRQAQPVLEASRRFRYTLDLKKEEENQQTLRKTRAHAQAIREKDQTEHCWQAGFPSLFGWRNSNSANKCW